MSRPRQVHACARPWLVYSCAARQQCSWVQTHHSTLRRGAPSTPRHACRPSTRAEAWRRAAARACAGWREAQTERLVARAARRGRAQHRTGQCRRLCSCEGVDCAGGTTRRGRGTCGAYCTVLYWVPLYSLLKAGDDDLGSFVFFECSNLLIFLARFVYEREQRSPLV